MMDKFKNFGGFFQASHLQVIMSSSACQASSNHFLATDATTSGYTNLSKLSENAFKEGKGDGESDHISCAGKPVRGGPVSWLSLLLLIMTGGGLIVYYDKEKKRHFEGT